MLFLAVSYMMSTSDFAMGSGITIRCEGLETGIHSMLCF